jgi:hypothetical protein
MRKFNLEAVIMLPKVPLENKSSERGRKRRKSTILTNVPKIKLPKKNCAALVRRRGKKQE